MVNLTGSAGTGDVIIENWNNFQYQLVKSKSDSQSLYFDVTFGKEKGTLLIVLKNGEIDESTVIDFNFDRPLGAYNDHSLFKVAKKILDRVNND